MICAVTGTLKDLTGQVLTNTKVVFYRSGIAGQDGDTVIPQYAEAISNGSGEINVNLYSGEYTAEAVSLNGAPEQFTVGVPDQASAVLSDLIDQNPPLTPSTLTQTIDARDEALQYRNDAQGAAATAGADAVAAVQVELDAQEASVQSLHDQTQTNAANVAAAIAAAEAVTAQDVSGGTVTRTFTEVCRPILGNLADLGPDYFLFRMGEHRRSYYRERVPGDALYTGALGNDLGEVANEAAARAVSGAATNDFYHNTTDGKFYKLNVTTGQIEIFRGPKAEFPQSYEIRAEAGRVIIFDEQTGEMWRVIDFTGFTIKDAVFVGGIFSVATTTGLVATDFADPNVSMTPALTYTTSTTPAIVDNAVNAVAATILPDAPATRANGMREITWAVGTDGGLSVSKNGGAVFDVTSDAGASYCKVKRVEFSDDGSRLLFGMDSTAAAPRTAYNIPIPTADRTVVGASNDPTDKDFGRVETGLPVPLGMSSTVGPLRYGRYFGNSAGVTHTWENPNDPASGMVAYQASNYVTPVMHGDVKGAFLCETGQAGTLVGADTHTADFSGYADIAAMLADGWVIEGSEAASLSIISGRLHCDGSNASVIYVRKSFGLVAGDQFGVETVTSGITNGYSRTRLGISATTGNGLSQNHDADTTYLEMLKVSYGANYLYLEFPPSHVGGINSVKLKAATPDRSVNGKGLIIKGSLTQDAEGWVSGFSAANYAEQPYNADLDFGTGDFYFGGWIEPNGSWQGLLHRTAAKLGANDAGYSLLASPTEFMAKINGVSINTPVQLKPSFAFCARRSGVLYLYIDGELKNSGAAAGDVTVAASTLTVGAYWQASAVIGNTANKVRRVCIGAGAPSHAQIKVMAAWDGMALPGTFKDQFFDETSGDLLVLTSSHLHRVDPNGRVTSEAATANFASQYFNREALA